MKKIKCLIIINFFLIFLFSCSNNQSAFINYVEDETLKINIKQKGENTIWTKELENSILTENIKKNSQVLNNSLSPTVMNIVSTQKDPVYPSFDNFVNLDDRNISIDLRNFLNNFCKTISENIYSVDSSYFSEDFVFSYIFFINDLIDNWEIKFKNKFPVLKPSEITAENKENIEKLQENNQLLKNWIFGQPFISEDYIQVPTRLFTVDGYIDVVILLKNNTPYEIFNMEIKNWESKYGK